MDGDSLFDWTLPVDRWPEEQLEAWARHNITKDILPQPDWHQRQVAIWARKECKFEQDDLDVLKKAKVKGATLLVIPNVKRLEDYGLPGGSADQLWAVIEKLQESEKRKKSLAEPDAIRQTKSAVLSVTREEFFQAQLAQARPRGLFEPIDRFILSEVGASFPLVGRAELLESLREEIRNDYEDHLRLLKLMCESTEKGELKIGNKAISFKFCYGAPGIGKTRFLYELTQNIIADNPLPCIKKWHTIFVPFTNGFSIINYDMSLSADTMLALRILKSELFGFKKLKDYCTELSNDSTHLHMTLEFAIELILKVFDLDNECGIILVIDEVNKCFEREMPSNYVKDMLTALAGVKSPDLPYVMPIFSGTSYVGFSEQVKASSFKLKEFPLGLLSNKNVIAMVEEVHRQKFIPAFHKSAAFNQLLRDCGGLPRFVQFVCEAAAEYYKKHQNIPMEEWDWTHIQDLCVKSISESYHTLPSEALINCLLGMPVDRKEVVGTKTWGQLEMSGAIVIVDHVPVIPYLGLLNFVKTMPDEKLKQLSIWSMLNAPRELFWSDIQISSSVYESFGNAIFQQ